MVEDCCVDPHPTLTYQSQDDSSSSQTSSSINRIWHQSGSGKKVPKQVLKYVRALIVFPDAKLYWQNMRSFHSEEFVEFIDEILKEMDSED